MNIGITRIEDLKGKNPEDSYFKDCIVKGFKEDKCQLYLFRMAIYIMQNILFGKKKLKCWYFLER